MPAGEGRAGIGRSTANVDAPIMREHPRRARPGGRSLRDLIVGTLLLSMMVGPVPPAQAHQPTGRINFVPSHFNGLDRCHGPDVRCTGDPGETNEGQIATDNFDGIDSRYNFRAGATPETRYYEWYHCVVESPSPFDPGDCVFIGRDDTPTLSTPPPGIDPVATFELAWDIPPLSQAAYHRRIVTLACIEGPPSDPTHCRSDVVHIHLDDASDTTDHPPTTSGQFLNLAHGSTVPKEGFTAIAYTSQEDIGRILFCLDRGVNPTEGHYFNASPAAGCDPGSARDTVPDDSGQCTSVPAGIDCWEVRIDPPDNDEFSLGIVEQDDPGAPFVESGTADCEGDTTVGGDEANTGDDCQLDKIYLTSSATAPPPPTPVPGPEPLPSGAPAACAGEGELNPVVGTDDRDVLQGTGEGDVMCGLGGKDVIRGLGGADLLMGGGRGDRLVGAGGNDRLRGEAGPDMLVGGGGRDRLAGGPGRDGCRTGAGRDTVSGC
jgi:RTX calcium-binding nonapeptide repeat (4 copies)